MKKKYQQPQMEMAAICNHSILMTSNNGPFYGGGTEDTGMGAD